MNYDEVKDMFPGRTYEELYGGLPCGVSVAHYLAGKGHENLPLFYCNQAFYECIGYQKEEFDTMGKNMLAIVVKGDCQAARQQIKDVICQEGKVISRDYRIHCPNGEESHISCSMRSIAGAEGHRFLVSVYMNIDYLSGQSQLWLNQQAKMEAITSQLSDMIEQIPNGCAVIQGGEAWELISGNEEFFHLSGYTLEEIQDMPNDIYDIVYKQDVRALRRAADEALRDGNTRECEFRIYDHAGKIHWCVVKIRFYYYKDGNPYYLVAVWDIHERKLVEEELHLQTERYKLLEEINKEFSFEYDVKNKTFLIPENFMFFHANIKNGYASARREEIERLIAPEDNEKFWEVIERASAEPEEGSIEYRMNAAANREEPEYIWLRTTYKSITDFNGRIVRILGRTEDISVEKIEHDEIEQKLKQDPLTGVLNKSAVRTAVEEFLSTEPEGEHALFMIDIDNFKNVNDTFGHLFGDSVLLNISEKIKGLFRSTDILGRIGGDEFVAFMKYTSEAQVRAKARSICDVVKQEYHGTEESASISCSVGVAVYGKIKEGYAALFTKADTAMYQAKQEGKNRYRLAESINPAWKVRRKDGEGRIGNYKAGQTQGFDFLTRAFLLLSHAKDVNNSLNVLMEQIGREYDLGAVVVLEYDQKKKEVHRTNSWNRQIGILPRETFSTEMPEWIKILSGLNQQEVICIDDCFKEELTEDYQKIFRENGIHAMVECSFSYFERGKGYVMFCDMKKSRSWNDFEKEIFQELARLISVFAAIRQQQEEEQKTIRRLKKRDPLTGLYNEAAFKEKIRETISDWREDMQYAVVYTDINNFSYINDKYGHDAGNEILREFGMSIKDEENVISSRLYSDLFISFVWGLDKDVILQKIVGKNLSFSNQQKQKYESENIKLSSGVYFMEEPEENLEIAIENANLARKSTKESDSICRIYEKQLRQQRENERRVIEDFQKTLGEGRIHVYIQPQFKMKDKKFYGGEALARWKTKKGKIEYPDSFIPALERSGYVTQLDFYVYEQVLKFLRKWKEEGKELPIISVNFSRKHYETGGIYRRVAELTEEYGIEPSCIEIEITESLFTMGYDMVKKEMQKLREAGFKVAIDDFGTGYSSLSMLLDVPVDMVKIDKSFLERENKKNARQFIRNLGQLIRSMEEEVIFEGVETEEQREFLIECGFEYGQGFLFERPIPIQMFEEKYIK